MRLWYNHWERSGRIAGEANIDCDRFRSGTRSYAAYLETPEGRLRSDLSFANIQEFLPLPPGAHSGRALDIGAGVGTIALRLAGLGFHVTLLDSSPQMLDLASSAAREAGMAASIAVQEGDASQAASLFQGEFFDLILCHNVLEFVDDPGAVLRSAEQLMRDGSLLSVLVRTQAGEVLKAAILAGDLDGATDSLFAEWGRESLYGGKVRLFQPEDVNEMLRQASLTAAAVRGVRVISDYLPPTISRETEYERILALDRKLGSRPEFAAVARYAQFLVRRTAREL
jgi:S-adenosylmethionine-dependent methyltransferase